MSLGNERTQGRRLGLALMVSIRICADTPPSTVTCNTLAGCYDVPYYGPALVNCRELAICVTFVAIAAVMTTVLFRPEASGGEFKKLRLVPELHHSRY